MPKLKSVAMLASAVLVAQFLVSKLYLLVLGTQTQQLFSITPYTGVGGKVLGDKLLGYMSGIIPIANPWTYLISMFIGAFVLVGIGMWIYEQKFAWKGNNLMQRLFAMLLYGHVALYALILLLKWGTVPGLALSLAIGLVINLVLVSALVTFSANRLHYPRI